MKRKFGDKRFVSTGEAAKVVGNKREMIVELCKDGTLDFEMDGRSPSGTRMLRLDQVLLFNKLYQEARNKFLEAKQELPEEPLPCDPEEFEELIGSNE